jgi:26S proteasome regulatory subunit N1
MLYFLVTAMYPRFMITLNENLESMPVTVRVGQVRIPSLQFWNRS